MRRLRIVPAALAVTALFALFALGGSSASAGGPNFAEDNDANDAAAAVASAIGIDLTAQPGYAGVRVLGYGVEVSLVGRPGRAVRAIVARDDRRYRGELIPVRYRSVRYSEQDLLAVRDRILADQAWWFARGAELTMWGPDPETDTVRIRLAHDPGRYRAALLARYGDRVSVDPQPMQPAQTQPGIQNGPGPGSAGH